ncbi:MAG: hypothetical protein KDA49_03620 [Rhodospirillaceae bacterium]|nr:hypothetical protein [Rhodospirillaceae bacterium]MCA8931527.1 hypothetical protein [Rhodospirillaceae bacterium]
MWKLVKLASLSAPFLKETWSVFSDELIIGIFWEESTFRNRPQYSKTCDQVGPAFGFGQVEPAGFGPYKALTKNKPPFSDLRQVITRDDWGAALSMRMLHYLYTENPGKREKMHALKSYGTAFGDPVRIGKINGWLKCEEILKAAKRTHKNADGYWLPPAGEIERALLAAKPNSDALIPEVIAGIP